MSGYSRRAVLASAAALGASLAGCTTGRDPDSTPTAEPASTTPEATATPSGERTSWTVSVLRVVDGDTVDVEFANGVQDTIRLLGVDTPETRAGDTNPSEWPGIPESEAGHRHLAAWGERAKQFAVEQLGGRDIYVEADPVADRRGGFGRLLAYVSQSPDDPVSFNRKLLDEGYARLYDTAFSRRDEFAAAEAAAREAGRGVWTFDEDATTTQVGSGALRIATVNADAEGDDRTNLNGEYVVLENATDRPLELGGWTLSDAADHEYVFPAGFELDAGATVTVYTGSGRNSATELYWGADSPVWNNSGDTVSVRSAAGDLVAEYAYD
ncbi:lamin tail domain-containing protein [Halobacterium litoreum]|uniref:Lamin tail domain-containing protein n=1 Tax=Halobacterium litoreum TaxID=2039234 RepID=A0ABD5NIN7_9EURY|nr:lamin tail domain-containing protein [Halobacterium litoreum]UHH12398.1 lamin tail domain-containing protein [Halobacterium litoreum]